MRQMTAVELSELLATNTSTIKIDVREEHELKNGMLEQSIHIPMHSLGEQLENLEQYKNNTVILICRSGHRSEQVGRYLEQIGFSDVINLSGGMNAWATYIDTSMTVY